MPAEWVSLIFGAGVAGVALVAVMVVPARIERALLLLVLGGLVASFAGLVSLVVSTGRVDVAILAALLAAGVFAAAYSVASMLVPIILKVPEAASIQADSESLTGAAVVISSPTEPAEYDPAVVASTIEHLDRSGVPLPGAAGRPIIFAGEKSRYRAAGGESPSEWSLRSVTAMVRNRLDGGQFAEVVTSGGDTPPRLDMIVAQLASAGYRRIVVAQLSVADSVRTDRARRAVDDLRPEANGIDVRYTPPLWASATIAAMLVERISAVVASTPLDRCGVALVGHGQPPEWQRDQPSANEHETFFHQRVKRGLLELGLSEQNVRLAWLDWQEPDATEALRHLAAFGCEKIVVVPASMPLDSTSTLVDIGQAVGLARLPAEIELVRLPAWGDHPAVADALAADVIETAAESKGTDVGERS